MSIICEDLITKLRIRSKIPAGQVGDAVILSFADDVIASKVLPLLMSQNQSYLKYSTSYTATGSNYKFRLPVGSVGGGAIEILRRDSDSEDALFYNMPIYTDADKARIRGMKRTYGFILTAGGFEVWPVPSGTFIIDVTYLLRPGKLIATSNTTKIASVDTVNNTIELAVLPAAFSNYTSFDIMKSDGLNERVAISLVRSNVAGSVYTVIGDISNVEVGDTIAPAGYAPFVQIPDEYIDFIVDHVTMKLAQHTGDVQLLKLSAESATASLPTIQNTTSPRISEEVSGITIDW